LTERAADSWFRLCPVGCRQACSFSIHCREVHFTNAQIDLCTSKAEQRKETVGVVDVDFHACISWNEQLVVPESMGKLESNHTNSHLSSSFTRVERMTRCCVGHLIMTLMKDNTESRRKVSVRSVRPRRQLEGTQRKMCACLHLKPLLRRCRLGHHDQHHWPAADQAQGPLVVVDSGITISTIGLPLIKRKSH
jgi:hypothetical protein